MIIYTYENLPKKASWKKNNLRKLQEVCEFFKTNTSDVKAQKRKAPYTEKIEELEQDWCTCL